MIEYDCFVPVDTQHLTSVCVDADTVEIHVAFRINDIHVVPPSNQSKNNRSISNSSPCRFYFMLYYVI